MNVNIQRSLDCFTEKIYYTIGHRYIILSSCPCTCWKMKLYRTRTEIKKTVVLVSIMKKRKEGLVMFKRFLGYAEAENNQIDLAGFKFVR